MKLELIEIDRLLHIEEFSKKRVRWLKKKIEKEGLWRVPIRVEKNHLLVLDGQHRLEVAKELKLLRIPAIMYDYNEVEVWSLRQNHEVNQALVIKKALGGKVYPYKTVKHRFPANSLGCNFILAELQKNNE